MSDQCEVTGCKAAATWTERIRNAHIDRVVRLCADCRHQFLTPYLQDPPLKGGKAHAGATRGSDAVVPVPKVQTLGAGSDADG